MKRSLLLIPALLLIATATVSAQEERGGRHGPRLEALDTNSDGIITREEANAPRLEYFARADTNNDGALTQAELEAASERRKAERKAERFARADTDGNGTISLEEFRPERGEARFDWLDANDDDQISADEMEAAKANRGERRGRRGRPNGPRGS